MKVGYYARFKNGNIAKCVNIDLFNRTYTFNNVIYEEPVSQYYYLEKRNYCYKDDLEKYINKDFKPSKDILDILQEGDLCVITFYSPRYKRRVTRLFQIVCIFEDKKYINFQNAYGNLFICGGDWSSQDKELKPIIKSVITSELLESVEFRI